jgi:hypothetical protein
MMRKMNGFELYNKLRKIDPGIKVCFLTTYSETYRREIGHCELNKDLFLNMPLRLKEIIGGNKEVNRYTIVLIVGKRANMIRQFYLISKISSAEMISLFLSLRYLVTGESFRLGIPSRYIFLLGAAFSINSQTGATSTPAL